MCIVCEKVGFAIETIESLFPEAELIEMFRESFQFDDPETEKTFMEGNPVMSCKANFVCLIAIRYAMKNRLDLHSFVKLFMALAAGEQSQLIIADLYKQATGKEFTKEHDSFRPRRMSDYES